MRLIRATVANHQFTLVAYVALLVLAVGALLTMPYSEDPPLDPPGVTVIAFYAGASPLEMEHLVVDPLEEAINQLEDLRLIRTKIEDGLAKLSIEFTPGADSEEKYNEVQHQINKVRRDLPADLNALEAINWSTSNVSILQLALVSPDQPYRDLHEEARRLKRMLERLEGVKKIELHGFPEEVAQVQVELRRLAGFGLRLDQVVDAIGARSTSIPGGSVRAGQRQFDVQTGGGYTDLEALRRTVVGASQGRLVHLEEVARVDFGYADHYYRTRYKGQRCLFLSVYQKQDADIFRVVARVREALDTSREELPGGMRLEVGFDQSRSVQQRIGTFSSNLIQGIALLGLFLVVLMGLRPALLVIAAIPLSLLVGLGWIYLNGFGLHQMTITGLIIALGLLVDNAIVVLESIMRLRQQGVERREAAIRGAELVAWPNLSATLTTVLAFLPILMMKDNTGDFIRSLPLTVIYALVASLLVSTTLVPLLAMWVLPRTYVPGRAYRYLEGWLERHYRPVLDHCVRRGWLTMAVVGGLVVGCLLLIPFIGVSFFPKAEKPQFLVDIELPRGASIAATDSVAAQVETVLAAQPEIQTYMTNVGKGNPVVYYNMNFAEPQPYFAQIFTLVDEEKGRSTAALAADLRRQFAGMPAARIHVREFKQGPALDAPIMIRVLGDDLQELAQLAGQVEEQLLAVPGTGYIDNPMRRSSTDVAVRVDNDRAEELGVAPVDISRTVRAAIAGVKAGHLRDSHGQYYDIVVRLPVGNDPVLEDLGRIQVSSRLGGQLPLAQVARVELAAGQSVINHYNLERAALIKAEVDDRPVEVVTGEVSARLAALPWPPQYRYLMGGESKSRQEAFGGLSQAALIALVAIYGVLVFQFRSFAQPVIVFSAIPLAAVGAILAMLLAGYSFSFTALLGLTSLIGIVVSESILLVDFANQRLVEGASLLAAVQDAGVTRFLPVALTALTDVIGLLPLALQGGTLWAPMSWAIIGGVLSSGLLVLLVVPTLYYLLARPKGQKRIDHA
ncbi:MAG: efflux RND transporter permease subunit [Candidatus Latescibacteria bacterium]|nr:efflux RND transporter permease subunit [Candidatus Latescibacterota bacterium]